ncbi:DNA helicase PcrA [Lutispora thermophila]|uniref:ATP-dependent DNA helicase n=1 Tax=Lutispora thermophila DSM 19022 TaxID=1122184 RepID=A0A1M6AZ53_9FIRM|nr:DNA helicase PcrA [Lutispora thermophila]SHI41513.1 ATP-dependent DNA helicase PcrA [Lutispora thermophila DSM 19022]
MNNLLDSLNKQQREAVVHTEGPLLVLAGAGSGKTRVLTYRIAYLINEKNVYPSNILAITFTNKAAREMKERVENLLEGSYDMWISTFHSACVRILRMEIEKLQGYKKNFIIFDTDDQAKIIKECLKELNYNEKNFPPKEMISSISKAKDQLMTPGKFMDRYGRDFRLKKVADIYSLYQKKLMENNALDFDDILFKTVELFQNNPDALQRYQQKFKYIMVDEYQDTNYCQYMLINLLAKSHRNLCVVGDDDQSIYSWRGADIGNILNFEKDFPDAKVIKLEQNYRSTQTILDAANSVISKNFGRKSKRLWTDNGEGKAIIYYKAMDERDEADFIIGEIDRLAFQEQISLNSFAILYRTNAQSRALEEMCMARGVPYKIVGGHRFYDRMEVKDIIAYLRVIQDPEGDLSIKRIINVPKRGIGKATIDQLEDYARQNGVSFYEALLFADNIDGISKKARNSIKDFVRLIAELMDIAENESASEVINQVILKSGYLEELEKGDDEAQERARNIKELISAALEYEEKNEDNSLTGFLENMALMSDIDGLKEDREGITMMTIHSAKGLEFPVVFICGLEEGLFPTQRAFFEEHQLEEERRLMYVAVTRAKEKLYLTSAFERTLYGSTSYTMESRFLREIPKDLIMKV